MGYNGSGSMANWMGIDQTSSHLWLPGHFFCPDVYNLCDLYYFKFSFPAVSGRCNYCYLVTHKVVVDSAFVKLTEEYIMNTIQYSN